MNRLQYSYAENLTNRFVIMRKSLTYLLFPVFLALANSGIHSSFAQTANIPSPSEFHNYKLGTTYTITSALYDYYRELGRRSPRVEYVEYGKSIQGRPLPMLLISSEENLSGKDVIRDAIQSITKVTGPIPADRLEQTINSIPGIVWIMIVDTDEEAGVEALQEVAYNLAVNDDSETSFIRDNLLVIMTPLTNPDSHARYVTWHKIYDVEGASTDPNSIENSAHWGMNTDGNAYGIDVNRDFGYFVTPEMSALAKEIMYWRPQLLLDIHSGPNVLFVPPFPPPYHPLWPPTAATWWQAVGKRAGENFGKKGWSFNTREGYEGVTSVGFGLSWAMLGSSVSSFLFESFGGRPGKTIAFRRSDGTVATMRMAMDRHIEAIKSVLQVASERKISLLRDAHFVVIDAVDKARDNPVRSVIFPVEGENTDPEKVNRLIQRLVLQDIEVKKAKESFSIETRSFLEMGSSSVQSFPEGSYIVDFVQPNARLARALLDPTLDYSDPQVLTPYERRMPYYDTTWDVLPYLFGVSAYAADKPVNVSSGTVDEVSSSGGMIKKLDSRESPYAYLLPPGLESNYRIAIRLMRDGFKLRVFRSGFQIGSTEYPTGTLAAIRSRNPDDLGRRIESLVQEHSGLAIEVAGPFTDSGVAFGDDRRLAAVPGPLVAVVADRPVTQDHVFGGIRNVLEADFGFAFSPVLLSTINSGDLSKYSAVVLPHAGMDIRGGPGFSQGYKGLLDVDNLKNYVRAGGTVIAVQGAGEVLASDEDLGRDVEFQGWAEYTNGAALRGQWVNRSDTNFNTITWRPGLNRENYPLLAAGYSGREFAVPGAYPVIFNVTAHGTARVIVSYSSDKDKLLLNGFMVESDTEKLAGRPYVVVQPFGRGKVIYFACDPTFRGYWYGLNTLFLNCLIFGPVL